MVSRAPTTTHRTIAPLRPIKILGDIVIFVVAAVVLAGFMWMLFAS